MDASTVLAIAIPALVGLAVVVAVVSMRRRDQAGLGHLSRETLSREAAVGLGVNDDVESVSGREVERAAALERIGGSIEPVKVATAPEVWTPPDP